MPHKKDTKKSVTSKVAGGATAAGKKGKKASVKRDVSVESSSSSASSSASGNLPDDLQCGICHDLLDGAVQTPCCGGLSCRQCIEAVAATANACPYCRAERLHAADLQRDVRIERMAASFVRRCSHDGCGFHGKREELRSHARTCSWRPTSDVIAELHNAEETWRRHRCWHLSALMNHTEDWVDVDHQLELMMCRWHAFSGTCCDQNEPRKALTPYDKHPPAPAGFAMMPLTKAELFTNPCGSPLIRLSHTSDQNEPTWCFIVKRRDPTSARRIVIPANASKYVVIPSFVTFKEAGVVANGCGCPQQDGADDDNGCECGLEFFLARTLKDLGLTEACRYAVADIEPY